MPYNMVLTTQVTIHVKTYQAAFSRVGDGRRYMQESNMFELVYGKQRRHKHF